MNAISQGAEAIIYKSKNRIIKERIPKSYRVSFIDSELRKKRTRKEAKVLSEVSKIINVPKVYSVDENEMKIEMDFINGEKIKDYLDNKKYSDKEKRNISKTIGTEIGLLHKNNITHGDLTTSNMILSDNKIYIIDFGLANHTNKIEDKAVELHLFKQALESKHYKIWEGCFKAFILGYKSSYKHHESTNLLTNSHELESGFVTVLKDGRVNKAKKRQVSDRRPMPSLTDAELVIKKFEQVELRGRNKQKGS